jgi:hypothetical protein
VAVIGEARGFRGRRRNPPGQRPYDDDLAARATEFPAADRVIFRGGAARLRARETSMGEHQDLSGTAPSAWPRSRDGPGGHQPNGASLRRIPATGVYRPRCGGIFATFRA